MYCCMDCWVVCRIIVGYSVLLNVVGWLVLVRICRQPWSVGKGSCLSIRSECKVTDTLISYFMCTANVVK